MELLDLFALVVLFVLVASGVGILSVLGMMPGRIGICPVTEHCNGQGEFQPAQRIRRLRRSVKEIKCPIPLRTPSDSYIVKLGGYVKLDAIYDFQDAGDRFLFDPNRIPIGGARGEQSAFDARQSRLNLEAVTPTARGNLRLFVEGDFFSSGNNIRLRHAYGELGGILAGQTWVLAVDQDAIPETLDFNGPQGNGNARQAQLRWTTRPSDIITWASSLHDPRNVISTTSPGELRERIPIFTTSLRLTHDSGHLYIYGGVAEARFVPDMGSSRQAAVWGSGASLLRRLGNDQIIVQGGIADGLADFLPNFLIEGPGDIAVSGELDPLLTYGFVFAYQHIWSDAVRSNVAFRTAVEDNSALQPGDAVHRNKYLAVNLIWSPLKNRRVDMGIEYLWGSRENKDGARADANRMIFSAIYRLP